MLEELQKGSKIIGLNMNYAKTKIMTNADDEVNDYIYLRKNIKINKENQIAEIRIRLDWRRQQFDKLSYILENERYPQYLKTGVYNQCVLLVLTYRSPTWVLIKS